MSWKPTDCPRFEACNAPMCPLDPDWRRSRHLEGEAVCRYLSEMAKNGGSAARLGECDGVMQEKLEGTYPLIAESSGAIRRALERASRKPSKLGRRPGPTKG